MKYLLTALVVLFFHFNLLSQCSCTDCPVPIISNQTTQSNIGISGSTNDQMGQNGQALCQICVNFIHDAPNEFDFILTSPSGTSVQLIGQTGLNVNQGVTFNICFISCSQPAMPDPGFSAVFDSSEPWASNTTYSGTYYPTNGCLENLTGAVNGNWNLTMTDFIGQDDGTLFNWNLIFSDDTGLGCSGAGSCSNMPPCLADAGVLSANPQPACPGSTVNYSVAGFQADPAYTQLLIVTDASGTILEINPNPAGTLSSNLCESFELYSYNFDPTSGALPPNVGANINQLDCNTFCCDLQSIPISFQDVVLPVFTNPPFDELLSCIDQLTPAAPQDWTDNCGSAGQALPIESGNADACSGGVILRTWEAMDDCGNVNTLSQMITVLPAPAPDFINAPPNITVSCDNVPLVPDDLIYTNFETGACEISGTVQGSVSGNYGTCGGTIFFDWIDVDNCGNPLIHQQTITVLPASLPVIIDAPQDVTITCDVVPPPPPILDYTNFSSGLCAFSGAIAPQIIDNTTNCSGEIIYLWQATVNCGINISHTQIVTIVPAVEAAFINPPQDITISCADFVNNPANLSYSNGLMGACEISGSVAAIPTGSADPCGSLVLNVWTFTDDCGRTISHVQNVTIEPALEAVFINPPQDVTLSCTNFLNAPQSLSYSNGEPGDCQISGSVMPLVTGDAHPCGSLVQNLWTFTDNCGRTISHLQNITIEPASEAVFIDPPQDLTLSCNNFSNTPPALNYSNGEAGACEISGSVLPTVTGDSDPCGGLIQNVWVFTDACGRVITNIQNITLDPAPPAVFIDPPADIVLNCGEPFPTAGDLSYSNGEVGICAIEGTISPSIVMPDAATQEITWAYTDPCTALDISYVQTITQLASPDISLNPASTTLCAGESYDLNSIAIIDINGSNPVITFHDASPASITNELSSTIITPVTNTTYYVLAVSSGNCSIELPFPVAVDAAPSAGMNGSGLFCFDPGVNININDYLTGSPDAGGSWADLDGSSLDISDPTNIDLNGLATGVYQFEYSLGGMGSCPLSTAIVTLEILPEIQIDLDLVACSPDLTSYEVTVQTNGYDITSDFGVVNDIGGNMVLISGIPAGQDIIITASDNVNQCTENIPVTAPDCSCDPVDPPVSGGDEVICFGDATPLLTVTVGAGQIANWYDAATGGNLLLADNTNFQPVETLPGIYQYYFEAENTVDGCVSNTRTLIVLEILPEIQIDIDLIACSSDLTSYEVTIQTNGYDITSDFGVVNDLGGNTVLISGIPTGQDIIITASDNVNQCNEDFSVTAPDCGCDPVDPPVSGGDEVICFGDATPLLTVTVGAGQIANWYDAATGGNLLLADNTNYQPAETLPGIYQYYVEAENTVDGCVSNTRTLVVLEILPEIQIDIDLIACSSDLTSYEVTVQTNGYDITSDFGVVNDLGGNMVLISGIPTGQDIIITASDNVNQCNEDFSVTAPDCGCDPVDPPVSGGDQMICVGDATPLLMVTVGTGQIANWYDAATGGNLLLADNTNYQPVETLPGIYQYYVEAENTADGCVSNTRTLVQLEIFALPEIQLTVTDETCGGDNNGMVEIISADGVNFNLNGGAWELTNIFTNLTSANYTAYVQNANDCINEMPFIIDPGLELTLSNFQSTCDDNNTSTDPTDDNYTISFVVNNNSGQAGSFTIMDGAIDYGLGNYGEVVNLNIPAAGQSFVLNISDVNSNCSTTVNVGPLNPCSTDCEIMVNTLSFNCQANGTASDPSDDFYEIIINASGINNGGSLDFEWLVDGVSQGIFPYDQNNTINLPADGSSPIITIIDNANNQCQIQQQIGPLDSCSGTCVMSAVVSNLQCDDEGTGEDDTDDTFTFDVLVSGQNTSANWIELSTGVSGNFDAIVNLGPFLITDGPFILQLFDGVDQSCFTTENITPPPACSNCSGTVDAGASATLTCLNPTATLMGSSNEAGTFTWTNVQGMPIGIGLTASANQAGWFYLTGDFGNNCIEVDSVFIDSNGDVPESNAGPDQRIDCDNLMVTLDGSLSSTGVNISYQWTDISGTPLGQNITLTVDQAGTYFLQVFNDDNGCDSGLDEIIVTEDLTMPEANAGPDQTMDCNNAMAILDGSLSSSGVDYIYQWTDENGTPVSMDQSTTVNTTGLFTLIVTDITNGCVSILDEVEVFENLAAPIADAGPDQSINCTVEQIIIDGTIVPFDPDIDYVWTDEDGNILTTNPVFQTTDPGIYNLQLINSVNGCSSAVDAVEILDETQEPQAIIYANPGNVIDCSITEVQLTTEVAPNVVYSWQIAGETFVQNEITVTAPGIIYLIAVDTLTGCSDDNNITIDDFTDYPLIDIMSPDFISCDATEIIVDGSNSQSGANISYVWYDGFGNLIPGANSNTLQVDIGGFYILESTDINNLCTNSDTIFVESYLDVPLSDPAEDLMLPCLETSGTLNFSLLNPVADVDIVWSTNEGEIINGQGTTTPQINGVGTYFVSVEDNFSGCIALDSLLVSNNPNVPEAVVAQIADEACQEEADGVINIQGVDGGVGPYTYTLNNGETNTTGNFSNLTPGLYALEIDDSNGCSIDTSFQIDPGVSVVVELPQIIELIETQQGNLQATVNIPENQIANIIWSPNDNLSCDDCLNPIVTAETSGEYLLTVIHENGCEASALIQLQVRPDVSVYIPTVFSPNGDGSNENFTLYGNERVVNIESLMIFDRWGAVVFINEDFDHSNPTLGWDGTHLNRPLNPAVFVFTAVVNYDDGSKERFSGDVTLVR